MSATWGRRMQVPWQKHALRAPLFLSQLPCSIHEATPILPISETTLQSLSHCCGSGQNTTTRRSQRYRSFRCTRKTFSGILFLLTCCVLPSSWALLLRPADTVFFLLLLTVHSIELLDNVCRDLKILYLQNNLIGKIGGWGFSVPALAARLPHCVIVGVEMELLCYPRNTLNSAPSAI